MEITFYRKNVYGVEKVYIADKHQASLVSALTNQKTLSSGHCVALEALGFTFKEVIAPKNA